MKRTRYRNTKDARRGRCWNLPNNETRLSGLRGSVSSVEIIRHVFSCVKKSNRWYRKVSTWTWEGVQEEGLLKVEGEGKKLKKFQK